MSDERTYLTTAALAARWGCSTRHVLDLIGAHDLRAARLGRGYRMELADVLAFEDSRETTPRAVRRRRRRAMRAPS